MFTSFIPCVQFNLLLLFQEGVLWTPSKMIARLGLEINDESSIYYWAAKNKIPVFSPALTDGSLGDMLFFHSYRNPGLVLDIISGKYLAGLVYNSILSFWHVR